MTNSSAPPASHDAKLMHLFVAYLLDKLEKANQDKSIEIPSATLSVIRGFLSDNSITIAHIRRGDFGGLAKTAADEFPFNEDGSIRGDTVMMGTAKKPN